MAHFLCDQTLEKWLKFRLSNTDNFKSARVIQIPQLVKVIKESRAQMINNSDLKRMNTMLDDLIIVDKKKKKEVSKKHVSNIKSSKKDKLLKEKAAKKTNQCPNCGGGLVKKKGKYGSFYGCGNYPTCRYTRRVS